MLQSVAAQLVKAEISLDPRDLVSAIYGLCKFHFNEDTGRTLGILSSRVRRNLSAYNLDDLSQVISSLARVGVCNRPLVSDVVSLISQSRLTVLSNQSISNLMTGLARFGAKSCPKHPIWETFGEEIVLRLQTDSEWTVPDLLATILAYSSAAFPKRDVTDRLFSSVSHYLLSESIVLDQAGVSKYLKACSRVEFRDVEMLAKCAFSLRHCPEFFTLTDTRDLLQIYTNLDKLGVDMKDLEEELRNRNISIPASKPATWFPQKTSSKPGKPLNVSKQSDSLRKRKYSW